MTNPALSIAREFALASDVATRKRGLRALAALPGGEPATLLLDRALRDPDEDGRQHAERVIADQEAGKSAAMRSALERSLASDARDTYALLGRLRLRGSHLDLGESPLAKRLRRALTLWRYLQLRHGWRFWFRGVVPSLIGATFALLLAGMGLALLDLDAPSEGYILGFAAAVLTSLTAPFVTPTALHFDRGAGVAGDALMAAVIALVAVAMVVAGVGYSPDAVLLIVVAPVGVVVIRVAVSLLGGSVSVRGLGFLLTTLGAGLTGIIVAWVAMLLCYAVFGFDPDQIEGAAPLAAAALSYAWVFARLDRPPTKRGGWRWSDSLPPLGSNFASRVGRTTATVVWGAAAGAIVLVYPGSVSIGVDGGTIELKAGSPAVTRQLDADRVRYGLAIRDAGQATFKLERVSEGNDSYELTVVAVPAKTDPVSIAVNVFSGVPRLGFALGPGQAQETGSTTLEPGLYALRIAQQNPYDEEPTALGRAMARARAKLAVPMPWDAELRLTAQLAPESPRPAHMAEPPQPPLPQAKSAPDASRSSRLRDRALPVAERQQIVKGLLSEGLVDFAGLVLDQVDFKGAGNLYQAVFTDASLRLTDFGSANLGAAQFSGANLEQSKLTRAYLANSTFRSANLRKADLSYANLRDADFSNADLSGASLLEVDMTDARTDGATVSATTRLDGTAWWFAAGWSDADIRLLRSLAPPSSMAKSTRYGAEIGRLQASAEMADSSYDRGTELNSLARHRATHGLELELALDEANNAVQLLRTQGDAARTDLGHALDTAGYIMIQQGDYPGAVQALRESTLLLGAGKCDTMPLEASVATYHLASALEMAGQEKEANQLFICVKARYRPTHERLLTPRKGRAQ